MQIVKINSIKTNPKNPRLIKDDKFKKLVKSIQEFPQMLELRPIVVDENNIILGGNMRYKACVEAGLKEIYILKAEDLTELQKDEFIVKDNVGFGEWDWDSLANEWDTDKLQDWGLDIPIIMDEPSYEDLIGEEKNKPATMKITFTSPEQLQKAEIEIQEILDKNYSGAYFSVSAGEI
jgi:ParB-like chromosome segregation protein Spo0J